MHTLDIFCHSASSRVSHVKKSRIVCVGHIKKNKKKNVSLALKVVPGRGAPHKCHPLGD